MRIAVAEIIRPIRAVAAAAMTPPPAMPEAVLAIALLIVTILAVALIVILSGVLLRLATAAGDERGQTAGVLAAGVAAWVGLRRIGLLLRLMLRTVLLLIARRKRLRVARQIRLRLRHMLWRLRLRREARLVLAHVRLAVVFPVIEVVIGRALRSALALLRLLIVVVGVLLAELLLRGGDQAEIMLGVLVVVFGRHRVA